MLKLRGVELEWIDTDTHLEGKQIGFIAQEAISVIPEVVEGAEGHYSMTYSPITALLVEAMKEQQSIIDEQKALIDRQQSELEELKKEFEWLKSVLQPTAQK